MKSGILIAALTVLAACSSNPSGSSQDAKVAQNDDPSKGIVCTTERPTGSFLKEKRCTTAQEREADRRQQGTLMDVRNDSGGLAQ